MNLVIRPSCGRGRSYKQDGKDGSDRGEGSFSSYGSQRVNRSHGGSAARGDSAAIGDHEEHRANVGSGRRGKESNGNEGVSGTNEESEAQELNGGENCSETDDPILERPVFQEFEHQLEVIHHLKRRINSSPCKCIYSYDMSYFQPLQIYFKLLFQSLNILNYISRYIFISSYLDASYFLPRTKISYLSNFITQIICLGSVQFSHSVMSNSL